VHSRRKYRYMEVMLEVELGLGWVLELEPSPSLPLEL
jgi:hypothetical protein